MITPPGAVVLAYHDVVAEGAEGYAVSAAQLRRHLELLDRLGYRIVPVAELAARLRTGRRLAGLAALTFDDGLVGVHRHALPILSDAGLPATAFVVSRRAGRLPSWWPGSRRTMTDAELRELAAAGIDLGAHTRTHANLVELVEAGAPDRARTEIDGCRRDLEDLTGRRVETFAYPYGEHDRVVRRLVHEAGYALALTFSNGRVTSALDPLRLPRLTMTAGHGRSRLLRHLLRPAWSWPAHQQDRIGPRPGSAPLPDALVQQRRTPVTPAAPRRDR